MYGFLWRKLPGSAPLRALQCLVLFLLAVFVLFQFVFPRLEPLLPFGDVTVNGGTTSSTGGAGGGATTSPSPGPSASTLNGAHRLPVAALHPTHGAVV